MTQAGNGDLADIVEGYRVIGFQGQMVSPLHPQEGSVYVYHGDYPDGEWFPDVIGSTTIPVIVYIGSTAPLNPVNGTLWWDDISGNLFIYYCDPNSCQWVVTNSIPAQTPIEGQFVVSFNGRSGVVVLTQADVLNALGGPLGVPSGGTGANNFLGNCVVFTTPNGLVQTTNGYLGVAPADSGLLLQTPPGQIASLGYGAYLSLQSTLTGGPPQAGTEIGGAIYFEAPGGGGGAKINTTAAANWFGGNFPGLLNFFTTPINQTVPVRNMTLDGAGNLYVSNSIGAGLGAPIAGTAIGHVMAAGSLFLSGQQSYLLSNAYDGGAGWAYTQAGTAAALAVLSGVFAWYSAAAGAVGAPVNFNPIATLDQVGNLAVASSLAVAGAGQGLPANMAAGHLVNTNPGTDDWVIVTASGAHLAANAYYDAVAATWRCLSSAAASRVTTFNTGAIGFYGAPAGVAGAPLTFSETAHVDEVGNFFAAKNLEVAGAITQPSNMAEGHVINGTPGGSGAYMILTAVDGAHLVGNAYFDGSQWRYLGGTTESGIAASARVTVDSTGATSFWSAPAGGAAGAVATFTQIGRLSAGGDLTVNQSLLVGGSAVPTGLYGAHVVNTAAFIAMAGQGGAHLFDGVYYNGSNFISLRAGSSLSRMQLSSAVMAVFTNPAVAVGGTVPFSTPATFNLTAAGNLTIAGTLTQGGSDLRLKSNIGPAGDALASIRSLEMISFDRDDRHFNVGFSAQDLQRKIPEAVPPSPDWGEDAFSHTIERSQPMLGFDLTPIVSYALKAIQELSDQVDKLQRRVFELEQQLREMRPN